MIRIAEMFRWLGTGLLLSLLLISGCVSSQSHNSTIEVDIPKSNTGVLTSEGREGGLRKMAEALQLRDEFLLNHAESSQQVSTPKDIYTYDEFQKDVVLLADLNADLATIGIESDAGTELGFHNLPVDSSRLISLPGFSPTEIREVLEMIQLKAETEKAYLSREESEFSNLPSPPKGIDQLIYLTRSDTAGRRFIRCGVRHFFSQPDHLWIQGVVINEHEDPTIQNNSDLDAIPEWIQLFIKLSAEQKKELHREDLEYALIQLSYIDIAGAMEIMAGFGVKTVDVISKIKFPVPFDDLPMVAAMPEPTEKQTALLGAESSSKGAFDLSITPSIATTLPNDANMSPSSQILVYYHPAHPIQLSKIKTLLRDFIDRPARQIFVEGMVLEISEDGLKELGVEWEFQEGNFEFLIGSINSNNPKPSTIGFDDLTQLGEDFWKVRLQALITEGKAEVLSRPSVLTLNNRQATIRVGTDIPIATSQEGAADNSNKISFNFKYIATGISLNIRPRINESGDEVSMLIDTIVSSRIPGQDLELRSADGDQILASAPTIATRRIQTYARIRDNTPFIIGGLVSKQFIQTTSKVPLLGDIPWLGRAFRSTSTKQTKSEVIIVLTPHVLADTASNRLGPHLPKDEDQFDRFGYKLFRDEYRIRAEDVFDLSFLSENKRLQFLLGSAWTAIQENPTLETVPPYDMFADKRIPGEKILVHRMIYEVVKRLSPEIKNDSDWLNNRVTVEHLILFESNQSAALNVKFLGQILIENSSGKKGYRSFFLENPEKVIAVIFYFDRNLMQKNRLFTEPIPEIQILSIRDDDDRTAWKQTLWELNQLAEDGRSRATILIQNESDLLRLQRSVLLGKIVKLNGGDFKMRLKNFSLGKVLMMPEAKPDQTHLLDADVARYFYETEHYYGALIQTFESSLQEIEQALRK